MQQIQYITYEMVRVDSLLSGALETTGTYTDLKALYVDYRANKFYLLQNGATMLPISFRADNQAFLRENEITWSEAMDLIQAGKIRDVYDNMNLYFEGGN